MDYLEKAFNDIKTTQGNKIRILTDITTALLLLHIIITGGYNVGKIYYCIGFRIIKPKMILIDLILFTLLMAIFPVESSHTNIFFQYVQKLYLLLLWFMVAVSRYYTSETMGLLVTHSVISISSFWEEYPPEQFPSVLKNILM